jgi:hypothetical protein
MIIKLMIIIITIIIIIIIKIIRIILIIIRRIGIMMSVHTVIEERERDRIVGGEV